MAISENVDELQLYWVLILSHSFCRDCVKILQQRQWKDCNRKIHFESGVKLGVGTFNLVS